VGGFGFCFPFRAEISLSSIFRLVAREPAAGLISSILSIICLITEALRSSVSLFIPNKRAADLIATFFFMISPEPVEHWTRLLRRLVTIGRFS
jgi:hypothetical protein